MLKLLLLGSCMLSGSFLYGQSEPSTEVTYAYLNKKAQEAIGHYRYHVALNDENKRGKYIYDEIEVGHIAKTNEIRIRYNRNAVSSGFNSYIMTYEFNPKHIKSIEISTTDQASPVGLVVISLAGTTGKFLGKNSNGSTEIESTDEMLLPFLQSDPENFNKINKALEHLKKLAAESEYDPFGN